MRGSGPMWQWQGKRHKLRGLHDEGQSGGCSQISWMINAMMSLIQHKISMFEAERRQATFDKYKLSLIIYGGQELHEDFLRRQAMIDNDPVLRFDPAILQRSRGELINIYAKKLIRYSELFPQEVSMHSGKSLFFDEQFPLGLHDFMFLSTLRNLCDAEQRTTLLGPAERGEILGCYAQTELGHGSDVQSLMTTATYEPQTQSFVLNTPEVQAAKWWIGDLGIFCTHACVFAQLLIRGKSHGVHAFVVPVRDGNHKPFAGLEVGDVGPKLGFNTKDNGYLIMRNYRIPREMMLMKFHKVARDGTYSVSGNEKISYATMLYIRSTIPYLAFAKTSKAATILTRYSLYRSQFRDNVGKEVPILDYQIQQEKIFPRIAEVFAAMFSFKTIYEMAQAVIEEVNRNVFDRLQEAHVITSSVKAISTKDGVRGLEVLRRAGGGHAYSYYSGIPGLQTELSPTFTFEGEYTILQLQVARFLLKNIDRAIHGKPLTSSVAYVARFSEPFEAVDLDNEEVLTNPANIAKFFEQNSLERVKRAAERIQNGMQKGMKLKNAWDEFSGLELVEAATAHGYTLMVRFFWAKITELCQDANLKEVLTSLFLLYAVEKIGELSLSFFETGVLGPASLKTYRLIRERLLAKIRPNALTIVEAFDYSDGNLHSAIGRSDGKAYETLLDWAKNMNDVNQPEHAESIRVLALSLKEEGTRLLKARL